MITVNSKHLLLFLCLILLVLGSLRAETHEEGELSSPLMMMRYDLHKELKEGASRDSIDDERKEVRGQNKERVSTYSNQERQGAALAFDEAEEEKQRPFGVEEPDSRHAEEGLEALDDRSSEMKRGSSSSQEEPQAGEKELKATTPDFIKEWSGLTPSQKKAAIATRWKRAIKLEAEVLEEVRQTMMMKCIERALLWNLAVEKAAQLTTAWTEIAALYHEEQEHPPYWIPFRWQSELETAEHKKALWIARHCYYEAERGETETYALRQKSLNARKTEILPSDPAIDHAIAAAYLWDKAVLSCQQGYENAGTYDQESWKTDLTYIIDKANEWYDWVRWYAEQAGRSGEPEVVAIVKKIPPPPVKLPSPLDRPSEREKEDYRGVKLLEYKEFVDPDPTSNPNGYQVHIRILKRKKKIDPYMRVEEWIDGTGALIKRSEMAADHLLVRLKEGMSEEELLSVLEEKGCHGCSLRRVVTKAVPLYRLYITPRTPEKWEEVWEQAVDTVKEMGLTWEPNFFLL